MTTEIARDEGFLLQLEQYSQSVQEFMLLLCFTRTQSVPARRQLRRAPLGEGCEKGGGLAIAAVLAVAAVGHVAAVLVAVLVGRHLGIPGRIKTGVSGPRNFGAVATGSVWWVYLVWVVSCCLLHLHVALPHCDVGAS